MPAPTTASVALALVCPTPPPTPTHPPTPLQAEHRLEQTIVRHLLGLGALAERMAKKALKARPPVPPKRPWQVLRALPQGAWPSARRRHASHLPRPATPACPACSTPSLPCLPASPTPAGGATAPPVDLPLCPSAAAAMPAMRQGHVSTNCRLSWQSGAGGLSVGGSLPCMRSCLGAAGHLQAAARHHGGVGPGAGGVDGHTRGPTPSAAGGGVEAGGGVQTGGAGRWGGGGGWECRQVGGCVPTGGWVQAGGWVQGQQGHEHSPSCSGSSSPHVVPSLVCSAAAAGVLVRASLHRIPAYPPACPLHIWVQGQPDLRQLPWVRQVGAAAALRTPPLNQCLQGS